jgi:hypothetical protein
MNSSAGYPSLSLRSDSPTSGVAVLLYPIGRAITDSNDSSYKDLSDQSKDRLVITNGGLMSEQTATEVYYRQ